MFPLLFAVWLALLPFVVWRTGYEGPKVVYFFAGCIPLSVFWIKRILIGWRKIEFSKVDYFYFLWLLILIIASVFGVHPFESIVGGSYRHQGVIFFLGLWLVGKTIALLNAKQKKLLIKFVATSVLVEGLIVAVQLFGGKLYFGKPLGTFGEANAVAGFLVIGSFFVFENFPWFVFIFPVALIFLLQSRSAILSLLPFIFKFKKGVYLVMGTIVTLVLVFIFLQKNVSVFENRPLIWELGIDQVMQKPILGYGAESGEVIYNLAYKKAEMPLSGLIVDRAHNLLLDLALWSGILGLTVFCYWLYISYSNINKLSHKLAFIALLIYAMLQPLSVVHWVLLFFILNS